MSTEPPSALDTRQPFTRAEALAAGFAPGKAPASRFTRLFHGVYLDAEVPVTPVVRAQAALKLFGPRAHASHVSAARVYGVPVPAIPDEHVTVTRSRDRRRPSGVVPHVNPTPEVRTRHGVRVSAPARMFVELVTCGELVAWCEASADTDAAGVPVRRYDLCWPAVRVIVEYDGRHHVEREQQWEADLARREAIDQDRWRILVVTSRGIYREPGQTVLKVWRLLRERGLAGVPARPREDWRSHFPTR